MKKIALWLISCGFLACNNPDQPADNNAVPAIAEPQSIGYNVLNVYPHDTSSFTQGLELYKGKMLESTGRYGRSSLKITDYTTGKATKSKSLGKEIFGEGITVLNDTLYQLTWQNHIIYVYNAKDLSLIKTLNWSNDGWGLTNDGANLIISDGSDKLYFVKPSDMKLQKVVSVTDNLGPVNNLNELEYINGYVYANRLQYDYIEKIDPQSGQVKGRIYFNDILKKFSKADLGYLAKNEDGAYLNGIAWDSASKKLFITGKLWPNLFEVQLSQ